MAGCGILLSRWRWEGCRCRRWRAGSGRLLGAVILAVGDRHVPAVLVPCRHMESWAVLQHH